MNLSPISDWSDSGIFRSVMSVRACPVANFPVRERERNEVIIQKGILDSTALYIEYQE
jgi:hypothetical protein